MLVSLKILSKKIETEVNGKKRTFNRYFSPVKIVVKGEEEKGRQRKSITVKFTQDVTLPKGYRFFILTVDTDKDQLSAPHIYEVKEDETGKLVYPTIWIRGYEEVKPLTPKSKPITEDVEFETEEVETEEHEIENDEADTPNNDNLPF